MGLYRSSEQLDRSPRDCYHLNFTFHFGEEARYSERKIMLHVEVKELEKRKNSGKLRFQNIKHDGSQDIQALRQARIPAVS